MGGTSPWRLGTSSSVAGVHYLSSFFSFHVDFATGTLEPLCRASKLSTSQPGLPMDALHSLYFFMTPWPALPCVNVDSLLPYVTSWPWTAGLYHCRPLRLRLWLPFHQYRVNQCHWRLHRHRHLHHIVLVYPLFKRNFYFSLSLLYDQLWSFFSFLRPDGSKTIFGLFFKPPYAEENYLERS